MYKISDIILFMMKKHSGQFDKGGQPYFLHPLTVSMKCKTDSEIVVALLHDVLEDTDTSVEELYEIGLSSGEIEAIQLLTKPKKEDYMHYIKRVSKNSLAKAVKIQDLLMNMDLTRLSIVTEKDIKRKEMYVKAYEYLIKGDD